MIKVLIIGASGSLGRVVTETLLSDTEAEITLFARHINVEEDIDEHRERVITGDVFDETQLDSALRGQDIVFVAVSGAIDLMASAIVAGMKRMNVNRLIFVSSMGIYDEIPASVGDGNLSNNPVLAPYRRAADTVEDSGLDFTILRPGWFDNAGDTNYQITQKGEPFGGHNVSRRSIADVVLKIVQDPQNYQTESIGINRPE